MSDSPQARPCVLLVEDEKVVRETIALLLEEHYDVFAADSIAMALDYLSPPKQTTPDIVLLDCLLPGGNLHDVLVRADSLAIPVVLTSGDPAQAVRIDPARVYLQKPFSQRTLLATLETARQ